MQKDIPLNVWEKLNFPSVKFGKRVKKKGRPWMFTNGESIWGHNPKQISEEIWSEISLPIVDLVYPHVGEVVELVRNRRQII